MYAAYTELKNAEKVKNFLVKKKFFSINHLPVRELDHIYFPLAKRVKVPNAKVVNTKFKFPERIKRLTVDGLLKNKLTKNQMKLLPRSQEVVGKILILEVPNELKKKEKLIAEAYLKVNNNIETVVAKKDMHKGEFRTRTVRILAGKRSKETVHLENGVRIKLHLEKTYFSARSANERLRLAKQVKKGESILVMFSGAAPFPLVFAKNTAAKEIDGIELNPLAHRYAVDNVELNNVADKINVYRGDVRTVLPKIKKRFDRIAMPLPKTGEEFLSLALGKVKKGGIIHLYSFLHETEIRGYAKKIKEICKGKVKILRKVKCGQFSPGTFRVCFDLKK